jgi:hypothetical protein
MKKLLLIAVLLLSPALLAGVFGGNPTAKITVHVTDDQGHVLTNFPCGAGSWINNLAHPSDPTANANGKTDASGNVSLELPCLFGNVSILTRPAVLGYYPNGLSYQFANVVIGKWQPWNPTINLVVSPIFNPIPMYARKVGVMGGDLTLPAKNTPIGFDLVAADWVAPYSKGTSADVIFTLSDIGSTNATQKPTESALTISFPNKGDGIQSVIGPEKNQGSAFRLLRYAPEGGYQATFVQKHSQVWVHGRLQENQNYFFRVRTLLDESGNVKSALYGKISGPIQFWDNAGLEFTYYLNPTPNDRNMEFDPKKNLFTNLPILEQVTAP